MIGRRTGQQFSFWVFCRFSVICIHFTKCSLQKKNRKRKEKNWYFSSSFTSAMTYVCVKDTPVFQSLEEN